MSAMTYNSRFFALLLAAVISLSTTFFLYVADNEVSWKNLFVVFAIAFSSGFIFIYLMLEYLIFRQVNKLQRVIERMKSNQQLERRDQRPPHALANPFKKLNKEIYDYSRKKQSEINELKRMEEYRREFLANVSHELKTPVFAAQGFIQTLLDGAITDKEVRKRFLKKSSKSLDNLSALVQDLITISQLESGEITMQKEYFDLRRLAEEVFEQMEPRAEKREFNLKLDTDSSQKVIEVFADPYRIQQVLINLVDNAIKYGGEKGTVKLSFKQDKKAVLINVSDNGPGIEPEKLPRLFERFYRVDKHRSRETGGTGLGLSIVKHILESHNTEITVTSKLGKGTTFTFALPNEE